MSRKIRPKPKLSVAKGQAPDWQRQRKISLILWVIIPLIIVLIFGLTGWWAYDTYVAPWGKVVARANETSYDMNYYVKMFRFYSIGVGGQIDRVSFPYQVLQIMEDNALTRQGASAFDIVINPDEITESLNNQLMTPEEAKGNATPTDEELADRYKEWLNVIKMSDKEYRQLIEVDIIRQKITEHLKENNVPLETEQIHLHAILLEEEETANEIYTQLQDGGNFSALAEEFSTLEGISTTGGDAGWIPRGIYTTIDDVAFGLAIGNVTEPISTTEGYYILEVSDKEESRPVDSDYRDVLANREFQSWLEEQRAASDIREYLDADDIDWAVDHR